MCSGEMIMAISSYSTVTDKFANLTKMPDENNG
ncbi:hypothetical protein EC991775_4347, partial [Escherichia coli 99.1775]